MEKTPTVVENLFRNVELETRVVAYALRKRPQVTAILNPSWLSCLPLQTVVKVLLRKKIVLPKESLLHQIRSSGFVKDKTEFSATETYVDTLYETPVDSIDEVNIREMVQQVYELFESRQCVFGVKKAIHHLKSFQLEKAKGLLRTLGRPLEKVGLSELNGEYLEDFDIRLEQAKEQVEKAAQEESLGIPTGISSLDYHLGGVMKGEFGVIAGEPSIGKTASLLCFGAHAYMMGFNVFFASGEMAKFPVQSRVDSNLTGIPSQKFRLGTLQKEDFDKWKKKIDALKEVQQSFFEFTAFPRKFTADTLEAEMMRIQDKHKQPVDLLIIDYLNIMDAVQSFKGESGKDWKNQAEAVWDVKSLSTDFNNTGLAIWTAGQIVDEYIGADRLSLKSLKYARAISEAAPIVIGLVRTEDDKYFNTMQLQVLKLRNSPPINAPILLHPSLDIMRINQVVHSSNSLLDLEDAEKNPERPSKKRLV